MDVDDLRERIAMLLDSGPTLRGSDLEARTMRGAVAGWTQAIGRVLEMIPVGIEAAALSEMRPSIAEMKAALQKVADGPVEGELLEPWIRYRMREASAALSPKSPTKARSE